MRLPEPLIIPRPKTGRSLPWDLSRLAFIGAAKRPTMTVDTEIRSGKFGKYDLLRYELLKSIHKHIVERHVLGELADSTRETIFNTLRTFFNYCDRESVQVSPKTFFIAVQGWTRSFKTASPHDLAQQQYVVRILAGVTGQDSTLLLKSFGISKRGAPLALKTNDARSEVVQQYVADLISLIDCLQPDKLYAPLPLPIQVRKSGPIYYHYSGTWKSTSTKYGYDVARRQNTLKGTSLHRRFPLLNLRVTAEAFLFIAMTGMNLAEVQKMKVEQYSRRSAGDHYEFREFKARAGHDVLFTIPKPYLPIFSAYLKFRETHLTEFKSSLLFPIYQRGGPASRKFHSGNLRNIFNELGVPFITTVELRKIKSNSIMEVSGDPGTESLILQHSRETFAKNYVRRSPQRAASEFTAFFKSEVAALRVSRAVDGAPCTQKDNPKPLTIASPDAPTPNCDTMAGCLFCENYKGVSSLDYIWRLRSYLQLKRLELKSHLYPNREHSRPILETMRRIRSIIRAFSQKNKQHEAWAQIADRKVNDGQFHPSWDLLIRFAQGDA